MVAGPALGIFLYVVLFRHLRLSSPLVKVVATLGLPVAIPALDHVIFGTQAISSAPGLAPEPVKVYHFLGVPVTLDQIIVYAASWPRWSSVRRSCATPTSDCKVPGHGRLAGDDRPLGHQSRCRVRRGVGGERRSSPG